MRLFLAFDTATDHLALALGDLDEPGAVVSARDFAARRAANTAVLPAVESLLLEAGFAARDVHAVAIGRGPGSFTGVRIGAATAKGLAHGLGVPLVGFGTLDAIAGRIMAADDHGRRGRRSASSTERAMSRIPALIGVLGDAMRGEVYPALFRVETDGVVSPVLHRLTDDRVVRPAVVAAEWAALGEPLTLTGSALAKYSDVFTEALGTAAHFAEERFWPPDGASLISAAWRAEGPLTLAAIRGLDRDVAFEAAHPAMLLPVYTRLADAEEAERLRLGAPQTAYPSGVAGPHAAQIRTESSKREGQ